MEEPEVRVGVPPSRHGTIHTGASWMWLARYSAAASILSNRSRLVPGAGSPDRYRGATCSSQARLYKAPIVSLIFESRTTRNRQRCMLPPLGAQTPASRIFRINSFGTESGFNRRIDRVVLMISNRSLLLVCSGMMSSLESDGLGRGCPMGSLGAREGTPPRFALAEVARSVGRTVTGSRGGCRRGGAWSQMIGVLS